MKKPDPTRNIADPVLRERARRAMVKHYFMRYAQEDALKVGHVGADRDDAMWMARVVCGGERMTEQVAAEVAMEEYKELNR